MTEAAGEFEGVTRIDERIDLEIVIGGSTTCAVTLTGVEVECGRQILNAVIDNILNAEQKAKRIQKADGSPAEPGGPERGGAEEVIAPFAGRERPRTTPT